MRQECLGAEMPARQPCMGICSLDRTMTHDTTLVCMLSGIKYIDKRIRILKGTTRGVPGGGGSAVGVRGDLKYQGREKGVRIYWSLPEGFREEVAMRPEFLEAATLSAVGAREWEARALVPPGGLPEERALAVGPQC